MALSSLQRYRKPADLPQRLAVFPLLGAILLPRATLPLNVFEPRYLSMLDDVIAGDRVLAIVQPEGANEESPLGKETPLRKVGCAGRVTSYQELDDGRMLITLTGIARCKVLPDVQTSKPYRICNVSFDAYREDFAAGVGESDVDRDVLVKALRRYLEARELTVDWSAVSKASTEVLINSLAIASPYDPNEKQALLEASDLKMRAECAPRS
jgi:uncharacterized protein